MKYKNYYKILGLNSSKVTDDEIKSAYRKLAKKYHPDINPGNFEATEKFKDVNEAYQTLTDESKKRKYDRIHFVYSLKDSVSIKNIKEYISQSGTQEFKEMFLGKQSIVKMKGKVSDTKGENIEVELNISLEEAFKGTQKKIALKIDGNTTKTFDVRVPNGITSGSKLRLKGQGKATRKGISAGDLLIKVNVLENEKFKLDGADLLVDVPLTPSEAILGCKVEVETLEDNITLEIPAGTNSGEKFKFDKKGYFDIEGNRGDLIAQAKIIIPKEISTEEKKLYEKIEKINKGTPKRGWRLHKNVLYYKYVEKLVLA